MSQILNFVVTDPVGLYAGPATELVDYVKQYNSHVTLSYSGKEVNLKSMMGVLSLGVPTKAKLMIKIEGPDEERAVKEIQEKVKELNISTFE